MATTADPTVKHPGRRRRLAIGMAVALLASALTAMLAGSVPVSTGDLWHMIGTRMGLIDDPERLTDSVLWAIRLPRMLTGLVVGAGLGAAGAGLQGVFRNHIAEPYLVGVAPAAGLGALAGIALTPVGGAPLLWMVGGLIGAFLMLLLMLRLARNTPDAGQLVLIGLAVGLALLALLAAIVLAWDSPRVPSFSFWLFGGLSTSTWSALGTGAPFVVVGTGVVVGRGRLLDLLALGDNEARHLGVDTGRLRTTAALGVASIVGAAVGMAGVVGFVGMFVPLLVRRWIGPSHRPLVAFSAAGGAITLVALDVGARTFAAPVEVPIGFLTAIIGAPVLVWHILGRRR